MAEEPKTRAEIAAAKRAVKAAEAAHLLAFREAVARVFVAYGLVLEADGDQSAHLVIRELRGPYDIDHELPREVQ